ncbi:MAG: imidazolonepropionase [Polyangiaceae bacterium]
MSRRFGFYADRVVTCDPSRTDASNPTGAITNAALVVDDGMVAYVGPRASAPEGTKYSDLGPELVTPGLVDAHTHAAWVGSRHAEYGIRMAGGDYRAIAAAGGGILSSHRAIAGTTLDGLVHTLTARLERMASLGVTSVEVKSGYGLTPELELLQLRAIDRVRREPKVPHVVPTFLALHAIPEAARADRDAYVRGQVDLVETVAREGLARFVDAYVDANAFTVDEARRLGLAARAHGLGVRLHVGQFADVGGVALAAELGARSADHLEHLGPADATTLAAAGVHTVLLPTASFTLGQAPPDVAALRRAGARFVVASDANPGTAPTESLPLAMALAVRSYGLTPAETLIAATRNAARSLELTDDTAPAAGMLREGGRADFVVWDLPHEDALVQPWGTSRTERVFRDGRVIYKARA